MESDVEYEDTSSLFRQKSGTVTAVSQEVHYRYSGHDLQLLSPYAYAAVIEVMLKKKRKGQGTTLHRNGTFAFHAEHPCHDEMEQVLRSHVHVPILAGAPRPRPPGRRPSADHASLVRWQAHATKWARYFTANFFAWDWQSGETPFWSYDDLCGKFVQACNEDEEQASWTRAPGMASFVEQDTCCNVSTPWEYA